MNFVLILSCPFSIQGKEPYLCDFIKILGLYLDIFKPISFKPNMMMETTSLHCDISLDDLDLHSRSQLYEKSKTFVPICLQISQSIRVKFSMLPQPIVY